MEEKQLTHVQIRAIRKALGMTLKEAADRCGVSLNTFSRWEREPSKSSAYAPNRASMKLLVQMEGEVKAKRFKGTRRANEAS